jgi:hypothetical protein
MLLDGELQELAQVLVADHGRVAVGRVERGVGRPVTQRGAELAAGGGEPQLGGRGESDGGVEEIGLVADEEDQNDFTEVDRLEVVERADGVARGDRAAVEGPGLERRIPDRGQVAVGEHVIVAEREHVHAVGHARADRARGDRRMADGDADRDRKRPSLPGVAHGVAARVAGRAAPGVDAAGNAGVDRNTVESRRDADAGPRREDADHRLAVGAEADARADHAPDRHQLADVAPLHGHRGAQAGQAPVRLGGAHRARRPARRVLGASWNGTEGDGGQHDRGHRGAEPGRRHS